MSGGPHQFPGARHLMRVFQRAAVMATHWVCASCLTEEAKQKEPVYDMVVGALDIPGKCDRCGKGGELVASMRVRV